MGEELRRWAQGYADSVPHLGLRSIELYLTTNALFSHFHYTQIYCRSYTGMLLVTKPTLHKLLSLFISRSTQLKYKYCFREQDTCLVVYTKDKAAKCRGPALELLIKVSTGPLLKLRTGYVAICAFDSFSSIFSLKYHLDMFVYLFIYCKYH